MPAKILVSGRGVEFLYHGWKRQGNELQLVWPESHQGRDENAAMTVGSLLARVVRLAVADGVGSNLRRRGFRGFAHRRCHGDFNAAVSVGWTAGMGIVAQTILGAKLAIDLVENSAQFGGTFRIKNGPSGRVRNGLQSVLARGVSAALIFHGANHNGIKKDVHAHGFAPGGVKIGAAGGFATVGDKNNDPAPITCLPA